MSASDELINQLTEVIKSSKDFVVAQAPEVARQMIVAQLIECGFFVLILVTLLLGMRKIFSWIDSKQKADKYFDGNGAKGAVWIVGAVLLMIVTPLVLVNLCNSVEALITPKLFLLERMKHL